jgi:uncharacterized protein YjbI with pentapeptide repeats
MVGSGSSSPAVASVAHGVPEPVASTPSRGSLERAKLRAEIAKLEAETDEKTGPAGFFSAYAAPLTALGAFLTAITAIAGVLLTLRGQNKEHTRQREADRTDRERSREQRETESARDLAQRLSQLLSDLGSDSEPVQAGAAVSLLSFLNDDSVLRRQIRLAVLANLKVEHPEAVTKLLIRTFERAVSNASLIPLEALELDLSGACLLGANLRGLALPGANLAGTDLRRADLRAAQLCDAFGLGVDLSKALIQGERSSLLNARLPKAVCVSTQFQGAELVNAHFEGAVLRNARFDGARLQAAHLEHGADLRGARFDGANVADTYFRDAVFDDAALRSLGKAKNVSKAHLSPADGERLRTLTT